MAVSTNVKLSTLSYVIIYVKNVNKSLEFYRDKLGLKVRMNEQGWVEFDTGSCTFALHADEKLPVQRDERTIVCFGVENIQDAYEALKSRGVHFDKEPHMVCEGEDGKQGKSADFRDPDGNRLSIFGYVKA